MSHKNRPRTACMIAYANYFTDARIKNYVNTLLKADYEVDVFALGKPEATMPGLRVFCLMPKVWSKRVLPYIISQVWFLFLAGVRVSATHIKKGYSFIHVHNMPNLIVMAALLPKLLGAKVILDVHDLMPQAYATKYALSLNHPLIRFLCYEERISAAFADHVITVHDLAKESLVEHDIPADKISIIMNLGNEAIFRPQPPRREHAGLVLVYHGTITERLGVDLILDALQQCRTRCPGIRFRLIGNGDYMSVVIALIKQYGLEDIIQVKDWVQVEKLPDYLSDADVGVVGMRKYYETYRNWGLPVKMLEYAAMEIPTIAPRLRVICHYFDETNAFLYKPDDSSDMAGCIVRIYQDRKLILQKKDGLKIFNQRYNWTAMEKAYLQIVENFEKDKAS